MKTEIFEFVIPEDLLPTLINSDTSGLDDVELRAVESLEQQAADLVEQEKGTHYCWNIPEGQEPFFTPYHDAPDVGASDCLNTECVVFIDETSVTA